MYIPFHRVDHFQITRKSGRDFICQTVSNHVDGLACSADAILSFGVGSRTFPLTAPGAFQRHLGAFLETPRGRPRTRETREDILSMGSVAVAVSRPVF